MSGKTLKLVIFFFFLLVFAPGVCLAAGAQEKTVRVGWYESPFNRIDAQGHRSGYAYEYQQKLAAHTGWKYEYVNGSWPELFEMLQEGKIDLLSDVSYTKERAEKMLFPTLPMGSETYYAFVMVDDAGSFGSDFDAFNGKKIGVNKNSIQERLLKEWLESNGIRAQVVELTGEESESVEMLKRGEINALVTLDAYGDENAHIPICKIGQSDFFFAVNLERKDLLGELNNALGKIQDENRYYNQQLFGKYFQNVGANAFLTSEEISWLSGHGTIRVGYLDDFLPFCSRSEAGKKEVTGALKDYLEQAAKCTKNATIEFETVPYPTGEKLLNALKKGEVDCVFPVGMDSFEAEQMGLITSVAVMQTELYAAVRRNDQIGIAPAQKRTAAVVKGDINQMLFIQDYFPEWRVKYFETEEKCFRSVADGSVDCVFISNYRLPLTEKLRESCRLSTLPTGKAINFSFVVGREGTTLYSILEKTVNLVFSASIDAALAAYSYPDRGLTIREFLKEHMMVILLVILATVLILVRYFVLRARRMKQELEEKIELQNRLLDQERKRHRADAMITALAADYRGVYYYDIDRDEAVCYRSDKSFPSKISEGDSFSFQEKAAYYAEKFISEKDRQDFLEFIKPEYILKKLSEKNMFSCRYIAMRNNQERYEMISIANMVLDGADERGKNVVCIGFADVDMQTREEMEKSHTLSLALYRANEASIAKTTFLNSMSHEIRTPLHAIIGFNRIALMDTGISDRVRGYLEKIRESAEHLIGLLSGILDMSRIESDRMILMEEEFSLREMIESVNILAREQCQTKGLSYDCSILGYIDEIYVGDGAKLKQVLVNILDNAVKYTSERGIVSLLVEILNRFEDKVTLRFAVKDTGIGMDESFLPRVFDAFSREDESISNKYGSTGLGMAITKNIVEMMNGKIEVESKKGAGSTFFVTVTLKVAGRTEKRNMKELAPEEMRVLVIHNAMEDCVQTRKIFEGAGISADICTGGTEAYSLLNQATLKLQPYHLILVDRNLPEDGIGVIKEIRERYDASFAVILLMADDWEDILEKAMDAGVDSFVFKPLFVTDALKEFQRILKERKKEEVQEKKADLTGKKILLVEDMVINAEVMKELLEMRDMVVEHAENGQIAVDMFRESKVGEYAAVLMDIRMPVMDGLTAAEQIRKMERPDAGMVPIIAMTANAFDEDIQRSMQAGMNAHLNKPVDIDLVFETLERLIKEDIEY